MEVVVVEMVEGQKLELPLLLRIRVVVVVDVYMAVRVEMVVLEFVFLHGSPKNNK